MPGEHEFMLAQSVLEGRVGRVDHGHALTSGSVATRPVAVGSAAAPMDLPARIDDFEHQRRPNNCSGYQAANAEECHASDATRHE